VVARACFWRFLPCRRFQAGISLRVPHRRPELHKHRVSKEMSLPPLCKSLSYFQAALESCFFFLPAILKTPPLPLPGSGLSLFALVPVLLRFPLDPFAFFRIPSFFSSLAPLCSRFLTRGSPSVSAKGNLPLPEAFSFSSPCRPCFPAPA